MRVFAFSDVSPPALDPNAKDTLWPKQCVRLFDWLAVHTENGVSAGIPNDLGEGQLRLMCADLVVATDEVHRDTKAATLRAIIFAQESAG